MFYSFYFVFELVRKFVLVLSNDTAFGVILILMQRKLEKSELAEESE